MIEMLEGVPGSGKSYHAVAEKFLPAVRAGRRIYIFVEGIYLDRLAAFEGTSQDELQKQITVWTTKDDVLKGLLTVEPGSLVVLDEVQTVFRAKEKQDPELLRWLETHRHRGIDIVLMCQQSGQLTLGVTRLVEVTTKFRRLDRFGLTNRYQAAVRGNPEETDVIRMFTGKYSPTVYAYYSSYSQAAVRETARGGSIMRSPTVILGVVGLVGAVIWFSSGTWLSVGAASKVPHTRSAISLPPPPSPPREAAAPVREGPDKEIHPLRIQGGIEGEQGWVWVAADGRILTEDDIAAETGGTVIGSTVRGVRHLSGTGVLYGSQGLDADGSRGASVFDANLPTSRKGFVESAGAVVGAPAEAPPAGSKDLLVTPPGL